MYPQWAPAGTIQRLFRNAPGQRSQRQAPVITLGLQQLSGLLQQADRAISLAENPGQRRAVQHHGEGPGRPVTDRLAELDRLFAVGQGIGTAQRKREQLGDGQGLGQGRQPGEGFLHAAWLDPLAGAGDEER